MWKTGSAILYTTKILPIQPNLWLHPQPQIRATLWKKEKSMKSFSLQIKSTLKESNISLNDIYESILPQTPHWIIKKPKVIFKLNELPKTKTHPITYQEKFYNILQHHPDHLYVFMDGSKDNNKTTCTAVLNKTIIKKALSKECSILTVEACARDLALDIILKSKHKKFIIFSDLFSVLLSLWNKKLENPLIIKLLSRWDSLSNLCDYMVDPKPHWSGRKWKSRLSWKISLISDPW